MNAGQNRAERRKKAIEKQREEMFKAQEQAILENWKHIGELEEENRRLRAQINAMQNATFWKSTKPARVLLDAIKGLFRPRKVERDGALRTAFSLSELDRQRSHRFEKKLRFSIIVPVYNTPPMLLSEMIDSVLAQTYADWELCLVDGSDAAHDESGRTCRAFAEKDSRVRYRKMEKNLGISRNSNVAIEMAQGDYIALLNHDDILHPAALYEVMCAICEKGADFVYTDECLIRNSPEDAFNPHFKPDYAPDNLVSNNYICHFAAFRRSLLDEVGLFDPACDGAQDHDLFLRLTERAERIVHIPEILYYGRAHSGSTAGGSCAKPCVIAAGVRAVEKRLNRLGVGGKAEPVKPDLPIYRVRYEIKGMPKVSILIANCEHLEDLKTCLDSIFLLTNWFNYEIVIVENNSRSPELFAYYQRLQKERANVRVVTWEGRFNFAAINNYGARFCKGEYLLLLNNDTKVISPGWIREMLMYAQRPDVGAVGAMLCHADRAIQHAGVGFDRGALPRHLFTGLRCGEGGYAARLLFAQDQSALTAACLMVRRSVWNEMKGFDENWAVIYNDFDFCFRLREAGYLNIWTPFAMLYHYESQSRGLDDSPEKRQRAEEETERFRLRWQKMLDAGDPYLNPNLTLDKSGLLVDPKGTRHPAR